MKFPDTPLRRGLCDCAICRELRDWWWQAMWMTLMTIAVHHESKESEVTTAKEDATMVMIRAAMDRVQERTTCTAKNPSPGCNVCSALVTLDSAITLIQASSKLSQDLDDDNSSNQKEPK